MTDSISYYIELILTLCGYDGVVASVSFGSILVVGLSLCIVIYAFYKAVVFTLWPDEEEIGHIKRTAIK